MKVLVVEFYISLPHALNMIKKLSIKRHAALGFYYDLQESDLLIKERHYRWEIEKSYPKLYSSKYPAYTQLWNLKIYRDVPDKYVNEEFTN